MDDSIIRIIGMLIYFLGAFIIVLPGIELLEKYHTPGKILRALEELEGKSIESDHVGFDEIRKVINNIVSDECQLSDDIHKIDVSTNIVSFGGRVIYLKVHGYSESRDEPVVIEEPPFHILRYKIDRTIRRGKTKIRSVGLLFILFGAAIQLWVDYVV